MMLQLLEFALLQREADNSTLCDSARIRSFVSLRGATWHHQADGFGIDDVWPATRPRRCARDAL